MNSKMILKKKVIYFILFNALFLTTNVFSQSVQPGKIKLGQETVSFFDGSSLTGELLEIEKRENLLWRHKSSLNPLQFDYQAVDTIIFDRKKIDQPISGNSKMRVIFKNKDFLIGTLNSLNDKKLVFSNDFHEKIQVNISDLTSIEFLPKSYKVLYNSSKDFKKWNKSNSKAWTEEKGNLISLFSGSTGITLPKVDAVEVNFKAKWERSFYLALRFFSDSDGSNYGSEGYHLSFSNNRINLQSNRKVNGKTIRETIGSIILDQLVGVKVAEFKVSAHRKKKVFIVHLNGQEVARWKDSTTDVTPINDGLLLINQGGNSYLRLEELSIAGWLGDYFINLSKRKQSDPDRQLISFKNGDSTLVIQSQSIDNGLSIKTSIGTYQVPLENVHLLSFPPQDDINNNDVPDYSEEVILSQSFGKLSFNVQSIQENILYGNHIYLGNFTLPLNRIKLLRCNLLVKLLDEYLDQIKSVEIALKSQDSEKAITLLEQTKPSLRCWYWARLKFLAKDSQPKEILWFNPHPNRGVSSSSLHGKKEISIFSNGRDGSFGFWFGHTKLAEGNFTDPESANEELGRIKNEKWKKISISTNFWLGKTEVSQIQFEKITGKNPSKQKGASLPVQVNWFEAKDYCEKLNQKYKPPPGFTWRLPTEAEWEYASKCLSTGPFCDTSYGKFKNDESTYSKHLDQYAWHSGNSDSKIHPIGLKSPNAWGLYDMHGNVWEWCADAASTNKTSLFQFPRFGSIDPASTIGDWKILKGGNFQTDHNRCRSAYRGANSPTVSDGDRGFRICLGPDLSKKYKQSEEVLFQHRGDLDTAIKSSQIPMVLIPKGNFMMGSRSDSNRPKALFDEENRVVVSGNNLGEIAINKLGGDSAEINLDVSNSIIEIKILKGKQQVIIGTENGSIYLIDYESKKIIKNFSDHDAPISSIAIDPKGTSFITCDLSGKLVFRDFDEENPVWVLTNQDYSGDIEYVEFSDDSQSILCSSLNSNVQIIDRSGTAPKVILDKSKGDVIIAKWLPNRNYISILQSNGKMSLVEPKSGMIYKIIHLNLPSAKDFSFTDDGEKILLTTEKGSCSLRNFPDDSAIVIIDPKGKTEKTPDFYFNFSKELSFTYSELEDFLIKFSSSKNSGNSRPMNTSTNKQLIATTHDGALRLWRKENGKYVGTIGDNLKSEFIECAFSKKGNDLIGKLASGHTLIYATKLDSIQDINQNK